MIALFDTGMELSYYGNSCKSSSELIFVAWVIENHLVVVLYFDMAHDRVKTACQCGCADAS